MWKLQIVAIVLAGSGTPLMAQQPPSVLADFPNVTVADYDVDGATVAAINRSIRDQRTRGPSRKVVPASTDWSVKANFDRQQIGTDCSIRGVRVEMVARVELPRLRDGARLSANERERWLDYVRLLEAGAATTLAFVHANLPKIEAVIAASGCGKAREEAAMAVALLRVHADRLTAATEKRLAALNDFRPAVLADAKRECRDLAVTGSRLRKLRTCLPAKEWDRLWKSSSAYTQDVVAKSSTLPRNFGKY